ncbi:MAG: ribose-phosphate diphosphokinase [Christensenellaceae bacterium]|nr:ribose-phosphate diphosphokinase [Christensenellaceae bacterium]
MHFEQGDIKIFAGSSGISFAKRMCKYLGAEMGKSEVIHFSDGNIFIRIQETVRDKDVYLVQPIGLDPNNELVEILFWMDAFKRASASTVTAIIPYFGYAKGDKKDEPRVSIRARVCADCIEVTGADRVVTMDLHSPQIQGFFRIPTDHLFSLPVLCEYVKGLDVFNEDFIVVSPDAGFAKDARKYADYLGKNVAIGDKTRTGHDEKAHILELIGDVQGKNCMIVDDFTISGGTLVDIANVLKAKGAKRIIACLAHNMLREKGVKKIDESPIEMLISTDTVENPYLLASKKMVTVSVAPLFAESVFRIHERVSVSPLFEHVPAKVVLTSEELDK